jgi:hypothetical protein
MGVLYWVKLNITDPNAGATSYNTKSTLTHLSLLEEISTLHVFQRVPVLDVLVASFEVETDLDSLATVQFSLSCYSADCEIHKIRRFNTKKNSEMKESEKEKEREREKERKKERKKKKRKREREREREKERETEREIGKKPICCN